MLILAFGFPFLSRAGGEVDEWNVSLPGKVARACTWGRGREDSRECPWASSLACSHLVGPEVEVYTMGGQVLITDAFF